MTVAINQITDPTYRHTYTRNPETTTREQKLDLEINSGRLVAEYYGLKMKLSPEKIADSPFYKNSQNFENHAPVMDFPVLALLDQLIADKKDTRPILLYAGWWHTSVYHSILSSWSKSHLIKPTFGLDVVDVVEGISYH